MSTLGHQYLRGSGFEVSKGFACWQILLKSAEIILFRVCLVGILVKLEAETTKIFQEFEVAWKKCPLEIVRRDAQDLREKFLVPMGMVWKPSIQFCCLFSGAVLETSLAFQTLEF